MPIRGIGTWNELVELIWLAECRRRSFVGTQRNEGQKGRIVPKWNITFFLCACEHVVRKTNRGSIEGKQLLASGVLRIHGRIECGARMMRFLEFRNSGFLLQRETDIVEPFQ